MLQLDTDGRMCFNEAMQLPAPLALAVTDFASESFVDDYDEVVQVADLAHPDAAMGNCATVSEAFVAFLAGRGIDADFVHTDDATTWGYQGTSRHGFPTEHGGDHYAVSVNGLLIDWTAAQFIGESSLPVVKENPSS
jgi:hypothetical protein